MLIQIYNNWFYQKDPGDLSNCNNPLMIIKDVCGLMLQAFDENPDTTLSIIDNVSLGHPKMLDNNEILFLSTSGNSYWSQNAYQLSHELCHHFIKKKSPSGNNSWLEESICELASIYFCQK